MGKIFREAIGSLLIGLGVYAASGFSTTGLIGGCLIWGGLFLLTDFE